MGGMGPPMGNWIGEQKCLGWEMTDEWGNEGMGPRKRGAL